jgi:hypothetical protein
VKESDRLAALEQLRLLGVDVDATADGLVIRGRGAAARRRAHRAAAIIASRWRSRSRGSRADGRRDRGSGVRRGVVPGFFERLAACGARVETRDERPRRHDRRAGGRGEIERLAALAGRLGFAHVDTGRCTAPWASSRTSAASRSTTTRSWARSSPPGASSWTRRPGRSSSTGATCRR